MQYTPKVADNQNQLHAKIGSVYHWMRDMTRLVDGLIDILERYLNFMYEGHPLLKLALNLLLSAMIFSTVILLHDYLS